MAFDPAARPIACAMLVPSAAPRALLTGRGGGTIVQGPSGRRDSMTKPEHPLGLTRREFVHASAIGALVGLRARPAYPRATAESKRTRSRVAFNTANLVARVSGYRFELAHWMDQHNQTVAATDEKAWRAICAEIAQAGFDAVEVWEAHASPDALDEPRAATWKAILDEAGLAPVAYAGRLRAQTLQMCRWLGIPHVDGGLGDLAPEAATALCRDFGLHFNYENHPDKSADEIRERIGGGNEWLGVCVDTGWLGTRGASGPEVIRSLGSLVRHTHIKDVKAKGAHETCRLGDGIADPAGCIQALKGLGYTGVYSWEDEPENRNPMESAARNREWIEQRLRS
jgi:L-ribulose-5-phosphate 3-epimerase